MSDITTMRTISLLYGVENSWPKNMEWQRYQVYTRVRGILDDEFCVDFISSEFYIGSNCKCIIFHRKTDFKAYWSVCNNCSVKSRVYTETDKLKEFEITDVYGVLDV